MGWFQAAVGVAGPVNPKLPNRISLGQCQQDDFNIEHKSVNVALSIQFSCDVAAIDLKPALCVCQIAESRNFIDQKTLKKNRAD
jgi:hypothetical protein